MFISYLQPTDNTIMDQVLLLAFIFILQLLSTQVDPDKKISYLLTYRDAVICFCITLLIGMILVRSAMKSVSASAAAMISTACVYCLSSALLDRFLTIGKKLSSD